ncbi:uncharacterized protein LOC130985259 isoform X2 [Salvia miltiorrhiza]|uniref:uncharacterized protein LOC130985259 isoform X2 n=1 Tax=Salvia miltiorrhiza TaxID=226208 RepID=UPI0025AD13EE|nr:uncharacterized protein LOC130985259 isoform X2 [Salvia miltiorrhiza]XP_057764117.1 uncharacterized protein LOC130985259 isoform X2 [Salvia miltiorrhiza]
MMQSPCIDACKAFGSSGFFLKGFQKQQQLLANNLDGRSVSSSPTHRYGYPCISCKFEDKSYRLVNVRGRPREDFEVSCWRGKVGAKGKDNVWSIDNEMSKAEKEKGRTRRRKRGGKRVRNVYQKGDRVLVSSSMLMEVETILQMQEPVIRPAWHTFVSSVSGIWKGVGAVYSPITAEMEPIEIGSKNENLFDCYTLSHIKALPSTSGALNSQIQRKINWVTLNPYGESQNNKGPNLPKIESFDFGRSDVMEEDVMGMEAGLIYFEDGSYSRGPVDIPVGEYNESNYYLSPTFKFEQCLVKGCHKRLRVVHTIEFSNGGSDIQIMRIAVYEEEWVSPAAIPDTSELELDLKPFSQRKRVQPSELSGSWKVFEVSATPIYGEDMTLEEGTSAPYVYLCTEALKKRSLPENLVYFGEEEMVDMQDMTVLWLPGGATAYVDVKKEGILCVGVGWYSDEGMNLVMERDYGLDGKLKEVRSKSEMKRRWTNPPPM